MSIYTPYFYIIQDTKNEKYYAGIRHARNALPSDLLTTYLTSSEIVNSIIEKDGIERFRIVKIKEFKTKKEVMIHEWKFLWRVSAKTNDRFYNICTPFPPKLKTYPKIINDIFELKGQTPGYPGLGKNWMWTKPQKELREIKKDLLSDKWEDVRKFKKQQDAILETFNRKELMNEVKKLSLITPNYKLPRNWHSRTESNLAAFYIELNSEQNILNRIERLQEVDYFSKFNGKELIDEIMQLSSKCSYHLRCGWSNRNVEGLLRIKNEILIKHDNEIKNYNFKLKKAQEIGVDAIIQEIEILMKILNYKLYPKWRKKGIVTLYDELCKMREKQKIYFYNKREAREAILELKKKLSVKLPWSWQNRTLMDLNRIYSDLLEKAEI